MPHKQTVTFVSVDGRLSILNSFKVTVKCSGIIHVESRLYIGDYFNSLVTVYDLKGTCLQTINTYQAGSSLFGKPTHMCLSPQKQQLFVADRAKGIVVTDLSGTLSAQYTYPNRILTQGICFDDDGNLFIVDHKSKEVVALGFDRSTTTVLTTLDRKPQAVCFQSDTRELFVSFKGSDDIQVFSVVY